METTVLEAQAAEKEYPSISDRIQSTFIDTFFIIIMMFVFATVLDNFETAPDWVRIILFVGVWILYDPLCTSYGCTIGNYIKDIRVRNRDSHSQKISLLNAFIRYVTKIMLGWLSFLTMHTNREKRALHDVFAGSVMVKTGV